MTGKSYTTTRPSLFALSVMQKMNDKCSQWKTAENIDYSCTEHLESTTYKFRQVPAKALRLGSRYYDKSYITNSYHVHVTEPIDAFTGLR